MNRGFTAIELIFTLAISSVIVFSIFSIPADLLRVDGNHSQLLAETNDLSLLKRAVINDLKQDNIVDGEGELIIGSATYTFDDVVKRNGRVISETPYLYELNENDIQVHNDNLSFKLNTSSSFTRR